MYRTQNLNPRRTVFCASIRLLAALDFLLEDFQEIFGELVVADNRDDGRFQRLVHLLLFADLLVARFQSLRPFQQLTRPPGSVTMNVSSRYTLIIGCQSTRRGS